MDRLSTDVGSTDLTDYGARLRRRWWVVALGALLGLAAGAALLSAQSKVYTSAAQVLVSPTASSAGNVDGGRTSGAVNLDTEAQIVRSAQVGDAARTLLRTDTPVTQLLQKLTVTVPPNSSILSIEFEAGKPAAAQDGAHAFAVAYLEDRKGQAQRSIDVQVANLNTQLAAVQTQLQDVSAKATALVANSPERALADAQRSIVQNQVSDILGRLAPLQAQSVDPGQIITDSTLPKKASSPVPALDLGAGLIAGLLLGLVLAFVADRADHRLRRPGDVTRQVGLPVLATVAADRSNGLGDEQSPAFDRLRNSLSGTDASVRALQVADPGGRGASGVVAAQLARSLVRAHGRSTLVLAHPDSVLPELLGVNGAPGLVEVLRGEASVNSVAIHVAALPGVLVVAPGRDPRQLESLLQSPTAYALLESLVSDTPGLVIETAGTGDSAAAQAVAAGADVLLLVAERGRTDARDVQKAVDGARSMGCSPSGVVLVAPVSSRGASAPQPSSEGTAPPVREGQRASVHAESVQATVVRPGGPGAQSLQK